MARYQGWFAFVLALAIAAGMFLVRTPLQLGLDLRGGSQLTVQVQPAGDVKLVGDREMEAVKAVLDRRVNGLGVADVNPCRGFEDHDKSGSLRVIVNRDVAMPSS